MGLLLRKKPLESVQIGEHVRVSVVELVGGSVALLFDAPADMKITAGAPLEAGRHRPHYVPEHRPLRDRFPPRSNPDRKP